MNENLIKEQLYQRYIEPTKKRRNPCIGIEIEMPILNLDKKPVDFAVIHKITANFMEKYQFHILGEDEEGNIYSITEEIHGDILSYDCSYNNLELSMGKEKDLFEIWNRFKEYYLFLQKQLGQYHYTLTGMG